MLATRLLPNAVAGAADRTPTAIVSTTDMVASILPFLPTIAAREEQGGKPDSVGGSLNFSAAAAIPSIVHQISDVADKCGIYRCGLDEIAMLRNLPWHEIPLDWVPRVLELVRRFRFELRVSFDGGRRELDFDAGED